MVHGKGITRRTRQIRSAEAMLGGAEVILGGAEGILGGLEVILGGAEGILGGLEVMLGGAEVKLGGLEVVLGGAEVVLGDSQGSEVVAGVVHVSVEVDFLLFMYVTRIRANRGAVAQIHLPHRASWVF